VRARRGRSRDAAAWLLERARGQTRAFHHRAELGPRDLRIDGGSVGEGREAAVGRRDDVLAPDVPGVLEDSLRDQLWVLDEVRRRVEDTGDDRLALG